MTEPRKCKVHTLEGVKLGTAEEDANGKTASIKSDDGKYSFNVYLGIFNAKYLYESEPTFYAC